MWREIIRVRIPLTDAKQAGPDFWGIFNLDQKPKGPRDWEVHISRGPSNEVMLTMDWDGNEAFQGGSPLARSLAQALKPFGMVELSAWDPKSPQPLTAEAAEPAPKYRRRRPAAEPNP